MRGIALIGYVLAVSPMAAQSAPGIPVRTVSVVASTDSGVIQNVFAMHARPDGRVLATDSLQNRVVLLESSLKSFKVVTELASPASSGSGAGSLLAFHGDSSVLVDAASRALIVIDAAGKLGRAMAPPKTTDMMYLGRPMYGVPRFDAKGRLYQRGAAAPSRTVRPTRDTITTSPDSAPILRVEFNARTVDTIVWLKFAPTRQRMTVENGRMTLTLIQNPLPLIDEWAVLSDGTVAVVRGIDYHVDWYASNLPVKQTPRMSFDWRRLTPSDKQRIVDSVQHMVDLGEAKRAALTNPITARLALVAPDELPDYAPALRASTQVRADPQGRVWIMPSTSVLTGGGTTFDVVSRDGVIVERVQLPRGRLLQGFGSDGTVFMSVPSSEGWVRIERGVIQR